MTNTGHELQIILGKNVKEKRNRLKLSREKLAEKVGLSRKQIYDIETGASFSSSETLVRLAKFFNTEVYELLKPENILPDDVSGVLARYNHEVSEAMEKIKGDFLRKRK